MEMVALDEVEESLNTWKKKKQIKQKKEDTQDKDHQD